MATSIVDADTLLAIDVGSVTTRAFYFDSVEGTYRFVAVGTSPSTYGPPINDASEGVRRALDALTEMTGRSFVNLDEQLIHPASAEGAGVDTVAASSSASEPLRIVSVGLLEDVSLESAGHLAETTYSRIVDSISMNDRRRMEGRIDDLLSSRPDLIIVAGGTENGASKSIVKMLDPIGLAIYLMPERQRPHILYAGNPAVADEVLATLGELTRVHVAPNIRPTLEDEQLGPASGELRTIYRRVFTDRNAGLQELDSWTQGRLMPTASGFGRMIRFFSQIYEPSKGVLGVDLGASSTIVSAAFAGELYQKIYSHLGMGAPVTRLLKVSSPANIARWLTHSFTEDEIRDYILYKSMYPQTLPMTGGELDLEQALAREVLRTALKDAQRTFPRDAKGSKPGLLPWFEPIIVSGSVLTQAPTRAQSMLMVLDALEPTGISTIVLDQSNILPSLGAAAEINPTLPIHVLESGALLNLGTVISPVGNARPGTPILRIKITTRSGEEKRIDIKQGTLTTIPLAYGREARLHLQPLHRYEIGMGGAGRSGGVSVVGGLLGIIIDARGRPLQLPSDPGRRRELFRKWVWTLGKGDA
jgi:hypothetical protein